MKKERSRDGRKDDVSIMYTTFTRMIQPTYSLDLDPGCKHGNSA